MQDIIQLIQKMFDNQNITKNIFTIFHDIPKKQDLMEQFAQLKTILGVQIADFISQIQVFGEESMRASQDNQIFKVFKISGQKIVKTTNIILDQLCQGTQILQKFQEQRTLSQSVICQLMEALKDYQKRQKDLVSMLEQFEQQNNQLKNKESILNNFIKKQEEKMYNLKNEITILKQHILNLNKEGEEIQEKISWYQQTVRKISIDNEIIKVQLDKQSQKYSELFKDYLVVKDSLKIRESQFQSLEKQLDQQSSSIQKLQLERFYQQRQQKLLQYATFDDLCSKFMELQNSFVSQHISENYSMDSQCSYIPQKKNLKFELQELEAAVFQSQSDKQQELCHTKSTQDASINTQKLISQTDLASILQITTQNNLPSQLTNQKPKKKNKQILKSDSLFFEINKIVKSSISNRMKKKLDLDFKLIKRI